MKNATTPLANSSWVSFKTNKQKKILIEDPVTALLDIYPRKMKHVYAEPVHKCSCM